MNKLVVYCAVMLLLTACSSNTTTEKFTYIDSRPLPVLKIPSDMPGVELNSAYPVPSVKGSIKGKTPEELEKLKTPPNLL